MVIGLEKDEDGIQNGGTIGFANRTGIQLVLDDSAQNVLRQFFPSSRGSGTNNSDFVILNGAHSSTHRLWEIVYTRSRNLVVSEVREAIDSIVASSPPPNAPVLSDPKREGDRFIFNVKGTAGHSGRLEFSNDATLWKPLREIDFTGEPQQITDLLSDESRFYRVIIFE